MVTKTQTPDCCECRAGEHDNYTDTVELVIVRDPDTNRFLLRGYLCTDHQAMFLDDGYNVIYQGTVIRPESAKW